MFFFDKFSRCFYKMSKDLLAKEEEEGGQCRRALGTRQYFDIVAFLTCTFRLLFATYLMYSDYQLPLDWAPWYDFRRHDVLVGFLHTFRSTFDHTTFLMIYFFDVAYFLLEFWCFRLDICPRNWRFWYQMTVTTLDDYYCFKLGSTQLKGIKSLKQAKYEQKLEAYFPLLGRLIPPKAKEIIAKNFASAEMAYRMEDVDVQQLQSRPLPAMPLLSWSIRARALKVMLLTEVFAYAFQLMIVLLYVIAMTVFIVVYPHWRRHHWLSIVEVVYEMIWPLVFLILLIRYVILFTTMTILGTLVFTSHLREWQNRVKAVLDAHFRKKRSFLKLPTIPVSGRLLLERLLREHNLISYLVVSCSDQLWGNVVLATVGTQIPINIVFVKKIVSPGSDQETTPLSLKFLLFIIFAIQLGVFAGIFVPLSWCQSQYHSPKKLVHRLMLSTTGSGAWWWTLRLKYAELYGRLVRGPKVAITVGPLHAITYLSSLEFLFTYFAYVLMIFSQ